MNYGPGSKRCMHAIRIASTLALAFSLGACASLHKPACADGSHPAIQDTLYFGTGKPDGAVTPDEWTAFLETKVTRRFPQGLTVSQASGQWRGAGGSIVHEPSHVLQLVHPDDTSSEDSIAEIIATYKVQFKQESVLRVKTATCVSF